MTRAHRVGTLIDMDNSSVNNQARAIAEVYAMDGRMVVSFGGREDEDATADLARAVTRIFGNLGPGAWEARVWDAVNEIPVNQVFVASSEFRASLMAEFVSWADQEEIDAFDSDVQIANGEITKQCSARCGDCGGCFG